MLVPQPGGGDSTNSQSEKKEIYEPKHEDKAMKEVSGGLMSPHYDIPVKTAAKRHLEFTQALNLRK